MPINITMPALSPTMEEGNLAKWLVKEGDQVKSGDVIAEIETDKATMEVEAVDEGTVAKIVVPAGTEAVKVNALIAILAAEGEDVAAAASSGGGAPAKAEAAPAPKAAEPAQQGSTPVAGVLVAACTPSRQGSRHRPVVRYRLRPPWPRRQGGYREGSRLRWHEVGCSVSRSRSRGTCCCTGQGPVGRCRAEALRAGFVRTSAA